ncbi:hypothetical protein T492DRAFT_1100413 [Pavlovales sp. CCMP2436]|nr:hypothetical protein T492DRAFT_1100413 [Pavlovales sp. CCMP2436]
MLTREVLQSNGPRRRLSPHALVDSLRHGEHALALSHELEATQARQLAAAELDLCEWREHERANVAFELLTSEAIGHQLEVQNAQFSREFAEMLEVHAAALAQAEAASLSVLRGLANGEILKALEPAIRAPLDLFLRLHAMPEEAPQAAVESDDALDRAPASAGAGGDESEGAESDGGEGTRPALRTSAERTEAAAPALFLDASFLDGRHGDESARGGEGEGSFLDEEQPTVAALFAALRAAAPAAGGASQSDRSHSLRASPIGSPDRTSLSATHSLGRTPLFTPTGDEPATERSQPARVPLHVLLAEQEAAEEYYPGMRRPAGASFGGVSFGAGSVNSTPTEEFYYGGAGGARRSSFGCNSQLAESVGDSVAGRSILSRSVADSIATEPRERVRKNNTAFGGDSAASLGYSGELSSVDWELPGRQRQPLASGTDVARLLSQCESLVARQSKEVAALSQAHPELAQTEPRALRAWHELVLADLEALTALAASSPALASAGSVDKSQAIAGSSKAARAATAQHLRAALFADESAEPAKAVVREVQGEEEAGKEHEASYSQSFAEESAVLSAGEYTLDFPDAPSELLDDADGSAEGRVLALLNELEARRAEVRTLLHTRSW